MNENWHDWYDTIEQLLRNPKFKLGESKLMELTRDLLDVSVKLVLNGIKNKLNGIPPELITDVGKEEDTYKKLYLIMNYFNAKRYDTGDIRRNIVDSDVKILMEKLSKVFKNIILVIVKYEGEDKPDKKYFIVNEDYGELQKFLNDNNDNYSFQYKDDEDDVVNFEGGDKLKGMLLSFKNKIIILNAINRANYDKLLAEEVARKAEEEERRKAEEARRKEEEERRKVEEARRKKEEERRKQQAEEAEKEARRKAEEEEARRKRQEEEERRKAEEAEEAEARRKAEEEEEARRKRQEEERRRRQEEERRKAEEEARRKRQEERKPVVDLKRPSTRTPAVEPQKREAEEVERHEQQEEPLQSSLLGEMKLLKPQEVSKFVEKKEVLPYKEPKFIENIEPLQLRYKLQPQPQSQPQSQPQPQPQPQPQQEPQQEPQPQQSQLRYKLQPQPQQSTPPITSRRKDTQFQTMWQQMLHPDWYFDNVTFDEFTRNPQKFMQPKRNSQGSFGDFLRYTLQY
jgi:DNA segregation ATPase FtsK/SpoIIIE-like protein